MDAYVTRTKTGGVQSGSLRSADAASSSSAKKRGAASQGGGSRARKIVRSRATKTRTTVDNVLNEIYLKYVRECPLPKTDGITFSWFAAASSSGKKARRTSIT